MGSIMFLMFLVQFCIDLALTANPFSSEMNAPMNSL